MRLFSGILAGQNFESILIGDESLSKRPMKRIIEPLNEMGAKIESENRLRASENLRQKSSASNFLSICRSLRHRSKSVLFSGRIERRRKNKQSAIPYQKPAFGFIEKSHGIDACLSRRGVEEKFVESEDGFVQEISIDGNSKLDCQRFKYSFGHFFGRVFYRRGGVFGRFGNRLWKMSV